VPHLLLEQWTQLADHFEMGHSEPLRQLVQTLKANLRSLQNSNIKKIRDLYQGINKFERAINLE
jgi:hypothetical protein